MLFGVYKDNNSIEAAQIWNLCSASFKPLRILKNCLWATDFQVDSGYSNSTLKSNTQMKLSYSSWSCIGLLEMESRL